MREKPSMDYFEYQVFQPFAHIWSSSFVPMVKLFGPIVLIYSVVRFRSCDPVSSKTGLVSKYIFFRSDNTTTRQLNAEVFCLQFLKVYAFLYKKNGIVKAGVFM